MELLKDLIHDGKINFVAQSGQEKGGDPVSLQTNKKNLWFVV